MSDGVGTNGVAHLYDHPSNIHGGDLVRLKSEPNMDQTVVLSDVDEDHVEIKHEGKIIKVAKSKLTLL